MTTHETTIHAVCPHGGWDYYSVSYSPVAFMTAEDFQNACDAVRGLEMYQEVLSDKLASFLMDGELTVIGRHGVTDTTVKIIIEGIDE